MCCLGINGEGELNREQITRGSRGKMAIKMECVCVCVFAHCLGDIVAYLCGARPVLLLISHSSAPCPAAVVLPPSAAVSVRNR